MNKKLIVPTQKIHGRVHAPEEGADDPLWLELLPPPPADASEPALFLRYALTEMGTERPIFPAVVLDDWGKELKQFEMYRWIREEGDLFPRAEVFGYTAAWREEQIFLRDLELHVRYPIMVYDTADAPHEAGRWVRHIVVPNTAVETPTRQPRPDKQSWPSDHISWPPFPLRLAKVTWWQVPPTAVATFQPS